MTEIATKAAERIKDRFHEEVRSLDRADYRAVMDDVIDHIQAHQDGLDEEELDEDEDEDEAAEGEV